MKEEIITTNEEETINAGEEFAKSLNAQDVVFLIGNLGSGKTTFTKGLAKGLGISTRIISPTFVIVRTHSTERDDIKTLYHLDLYRMSSEGEVLGVDLKDFLDDKNGLVVIEWPEMGQNLVSKKVWTVTLEQIDENSRRIKFEYGN